MCSSEARQKVMKFHNSESTQTQFALSEFWELLELPSALVILKKKKKALTVPNLCAECLDMICLYGMREEFLHSQ